MFIKRSFIVDSGCTDHIINDNTIFQTKNLVDKIIITGNNTIEKTNIEGEIHILCENTTKFMEHIRLNNVLFSPKVHNVLSVQRMTNLGFEIYFSRDKNYIILPNKNKIELRNENNLFYLDYYILNKKPTILKMGNERYQNATSLLKSQMGNERYLNAISLLKSLDLI